MITWLSMPSLQSFGERKRDWSWTAAGQGTLSAKKRVVNTMSHFERWVHCAESGVTPYKSWRRISFSRYTTKTVCCNLQHDTEFDSTKTSLLLLFLVTSITISWEYHGGKWSCCADNISFMMRWDQLVPRSKPYLSTLVPQHFVSMKLVPVAIQSYETVQEEVARMAVTQKGLGS